MHLIISPFLGDFIGEPGIDWIKYLLTEFDKLIIICRQAVVDYCVNDNNKTSNIIIIIDSNNDNGINNSKNINDNV